MQEYIFKPALSILIYKGSGYGYVEGRKILKTNDGYEMGEAYPISDEQLRDVFSSLTDTTHLGFISPQILYVSPDTVLFKSSPKVKRICYDDDGDKTIDIKFLNVHLLFEVSSTKHLRVFAFKGKFSKDVMLYELPFPNISSDGSVCMGNVEIPNYNNVSELVEIYEKAFYNSRFTHLHNTCEKNWQNTIKTKTVDSKNLIKLGKLHEVIPLH